MTKILQDETISYKVEHISIFKTDLKLYAS